MSHPTNEALLDLDGLFDDGLHGRPGGLVLQGVEKLTCKVAVQPLVPADHLVAERQPGHQAPLLEPEDGAEASREEYSLGQESRKGARKTEGEGRRERGKEGEEGGRRDEEGLYAVFERVTTSLGGKTRPTHPCAPVND